MRILVTGATGFIGSHLVVHLLACGHEVVATGRKPSSLPYLASLPGCSVARLDLADRTGWEELLRDCDALAHVALGWGDDGPAMLANDTAASVELFETCLRTGVPRAVYVSSTAAAGSMTPIVSEDRSPCPTDLYGATKAATEMFARAFERRGLAVHVVRPGYVFGEPALVGGRPQPDRRFESICRAIHAGDPVHLTLHDGTQFLPAPDLARVLEAVLHLPNVFTLHHALASAWTSWADIARMAMDIAGRSVQLELEDRGLGADPWVFSVDGIRRDLGLSFDGRLALRRHVAWEVDRAARLMSETSFDSTPLAS